MKFNQWILIGCLVVTLSLCAVIPFVFAQTVSDDLLIERTLDEFEVNGRIIEQVEFQNTDINEVLKVISQKSGLNIVASDEVKGKVTIFLKEVDAKDALRIILQTNNLAYVEENGIIQVLSAQQYEQQYGFPFSQSVGSKIVPLLHSDGNNLMDVLNEMKTETGKVIFNELNNTIVLMDTPAVVEAMRSYIASTDVPLETKTLTVKYAGLQDTVRQIEELLTPKVGTIKVDEPRRQVTVTDTLIKVRDIEKLITQLDDSNKEMVMETSILQIILHDEHLNGVDWEAIVSNFQKVEFLGLKNTIEGKDGFIHLGTVTAEDFEVLKEALDTVGQINTIGSLTYPGQTQIPFEVSVNGLDEVSFNDQDLKLEAKDRNEDLNLTVNVLDKIGSAYHINIEPEVFGLSEQPAQINVEEGSTIVIGGLFKDVTMKETRKIPLLSDIPLIRDVPFSEIPILGFAFRNQKKSERKTEMIIFLTSKITEKK